MAWLTVCTVLIAALVFDASRGFDYFMPDTQDGATEPIYTATADDGTADRVSAIEARLASFEAQHSADRAHLTAVLDQQTAQLTATTSQLTTVVAQLTSLRAENERLKQRLDDANSSLSLRLDNLEDLSGRHVSFHARSAQSDQPQVSDRLVVNDVITNQGSAYNGTAGVFTAPYNGTYFFTATTGPSDLPRGSSLGLNLQVGDNSVASVKTEAEGSSEAATLHVIVYLSVGQTVWLQMWGNTMYWADAAMFSGFLITADP